MGSMSEAWNRVRGHLTLQDLMLDVTGKMLVALGLGALFGDFVRPRAWYFIIGGVLLSVVAKLKYMKHLKP